MEPSSSGGCNAIYVWNICTYHTCAYARASNNNNKKELNYFGTPHQYTQTHIQITIREDVKKHKKNYLKTFAKVGQYDFRLSALTV